jgi:cytochrome d ubiquinol oxidase subunit I
MRMEMTSFAELLLNPVAQVKFVHTVSAGYVTGAMFVLGISAYYLLQGRDIGFARRSFAIAAGFGLASALSVVVLGDESGYELGDVQKTKMAAIEAEWETQPAPADFTLFGFPDQENETTHAAIKIPWVLGLIATRSTDEEIMGIKELKLEHEGRIRNGMIAYDLLQKLRNGQTDDTTRAAFEEVKKDLGYGLLLKKYTANVVDANEAQIQQAVDDTIPEVWPLFWSFRLMVLFGFWFIVLFAFAFWYCTKRVADQKTWLLKAALWSIPLPWITSELGWFVAEYGRQPWSIGEVLPTHLSTSTLSAGDLYFSIAGFVGFYTLLLVVELYLMFRFARLGPSSLHSGRYHFEQSAGQALPEGVSR